MSMTPEEQARFHADAEKRIKLFKYEKPVLAGRPKKVVNLIRGESPMLSVVVQYVGEGGENNIHYHTHSETGWMVLKGQARFTGVDGVICELGEMEGVFLPGGCRYRFEKIGDVDLEIIQMVGIETHTGKSERINVEAHKDWMANDKHLQKYKETENA
jgi:mannose-6-phosphate isomerase-like protein (cupin superfamily)